MKYLTLKELNNSHYEVQFEARTIGEFIRDVDGYFYLFFNSANGCWSDYILIELGETLAELNKEWNNIVNKELNE